MFFFLIRCNPRWLNSLVTYYRFDSSPKFLIICKNFSVLYLKKTFYVLSHITYYNLLQKFFCFFISYYIRYPSYLLISVFLYLYFHLFSFRYFLSSSNHFIIALLRVLFIYGVWFAPTNFVFKGACLCNTLKNSISKDLQDSVYFSCLFKALFKKLQLKFSYFLLTIFLRADFGNDAFKTLNIILLIKVSYITVAKNGRILKTLNTVYQK